MKKLVLVLMLGLSILGKAQSVAYSNEFYSRFGGLESDSITFVEELNLSPKIKTPGKNLSAKYHLIKAGELKNQSIAISSGGVLGSAILIQQEEYTGAAIVALTSAIISLVNEISANKHLILAGKKLK
jgi:hypothetical protein